MFKNTSKFTSVILSLFLVLGLSLIVVGSTYKGPVPQEFDQAPMLAKLVEQGELPPVKDRLPKDPYVAQPIDRIGDYGGTIHTVTTRPRSWGEDIMAMTPFGSYLRATPSGDGFITHFAAKVESSEDKTTWTIKLREGVKWSDGHPFTTEDVKFWYEDVLLNKDLTPVVGPTFKAAGEIAELKVMDDYTMQFKFAAPKPYFENRMVFMGWGGNFFLPKHYLKNYHPNYVAEEELQEKIKEAGFDNWWELFEDANSRVSKVPMTPERPTITPYKLEKITSDRRIYVRNPYYWKVDPEGNQLPYIDRIETNIITDQEVEQGMILSGQIDYAVYNTDVRNYPMYKQNESKGGYRTVLLKGLPNEVVYMINITHQDPVLREIFQDLRFRKALSLAINRQEISDVIYFGRAEPRQTTVADKSKWFEPEFANAYVEYNPEKARALLDEMGLKDTNGDGWRERPDGKKLTFTIEFYTLEAPKVPNVELVSQYWQEVGIDVKSKAISGELQGQRAPANLMDATVFQGHVATDVRFPVVPNFWVPESPGWETSTWPTWSRWLTTGGEEGEEPPEKVKNLYEWWQEMITEPDEERRVELGKKILKSQAENLWTIGTVGNGPYPLIVDKDILNVPKEGTFTSSTGWSWCTDPEMFFFEGGEDKGK